MNRLTSGQYWGHKKFQHFIAGGDIIITQSNYEPGLHLPVHFHENFVLGYVNQGSFLEKHGATEKLCDADQLLIQPPQSVHENSIRATPLSIFNIEINNQWWQNNCAGALQLKNWEILKSPYITNVVKKIKHEASDWDDYSAVLLECHIIELLVMIGRVNSRTVNQQVPYRIKKVREKISDEWQINHSLQQLAVLAGIHPIYLAREFKKYMGCSIGEFAREIKLSNALKKLMDPDKSIMEISLECGFSDASHFIRVFKKKMGCTPQYFRAKK